MTIEEVATAILIMCGKGDADVKWTCVDYYNNCLISKNLSPSIDDLAACKDNESAGMKRIQALREEK